MSTERARPDFVLRERENLLGWLDYHRATLALKCEGLTPQQLATRAVEPSSLSLIGLVRHMSDLERSWFRQVFEGQEVPRIYLLEQGGYDEAFDSVDADVVESSLAWWAAERAVADELLARHSLDEISVRAWRDERIGLRWIVSHIIEEYARHNGHADLLRERLDGATGN
jgi:hypothetical protein